jgi:energy-coupling factor transport system permease protein
MKSLALGRYIPYNSWIHRLDPRAKLGSMVFLMILIFIRFSNISTNLTVYAFLFLFMFGLLRMTKIKIAQLFKQLKALWLMMTFLLIINVLIPLPINPDWYYEFLGLRIYGDSLVQTLYIVVRLMLMISLTLILTTSTKPLDLTYAIEWYLAPLKKLRFPSHEVAMTISIALRFIPTLLEEAMRIMNAQASRGVDFVHGKMAEKIRAIISLIVPLFISSFQRSEELANAMEARGYNPLATRTRYRQLAWKNMDTLSLSIVLFLFIGILLLQIIDFNITDYLL